MVRIFLTTLFAAVAICFGATIFAAKDAKTDLALAGKMQQLQQILQQASQSDDASQAALSSPTNVTQAPSAGVVSSPSATAATVDNKSAPAKKAPAKPGANVYDKAFANVINQLLPLSPAQVAKLHEVYEQSQLSAALPAGVPPRPTSTTLMIDLSPKATPPIIRLGAGYISSLVFVDATGQPWPIAAYSIGDPGSFNIQWDQKGNTLLIQSSTFYKRTNMAVILRDLNTPVMIDLISGQKAVDYRVDLRVSGIGPNAVFAHGGLPDSSNPILLEVLNGVPPKGSKELKVTGGTCQAWVLDKKLYLRTNLTVISPGWESIMSSIDGTHAYQLQPAPIVLALQNGRDKVLTLMLEGLE